MRIILSIGLVLIGIVWCPDAGSVWAAQPKSSALEHAIAAKDFERVIYSALTRQYGRPHHRLKVGILSPQKPLVVPAGKIHLEVACTLLHGLLEQLIQSGGHDKLSLIE